MDLTRSISDSFSRAAHIYDEFAEVQCYSANVCGQRILEALPLLPPGPILEVGCGTGFLTQQLVYYAREREIIAADLSCEMLDACKLRMETEFGMLPNVSFEQVDVQNLDGRRKFALIAASFSFQWFTDLPTTVEKLMSALLPGGIMVFCFPTRESFREWRTVCDKSGREFSGNPLPEVGDFKEYATTCGYDLKSYELDYVLRYDSPLDFFKSLRSTGAATRLRKNLRSDNQLVSVVRAWERDSQSASVTYRVLFGTLWKKSSEAEEYA
jgi:malonyl-CoA O-methyltransferase